MLSLPARRRCRPCVDASGRPSCSENLRDERMLRTMAPHPEVVALLAFSRLLQEAAVVGASECRRGLRSVAFRPDRSLGGQARGGQGARQGRPAPIRLAGAVTKPAG